MKKKYLPLVVDIRYLEDEDILTMSPDDPNSPFFGESDSDGWT